jgi:lambda repressor-like predicted transcriptional regulator
LEPLVERFGDVSTLARALGRQRTLVAKWRTGGLPLASADGVAIALGLHPVEVWPDWYELNQPAFRDAA